MQDKTATEELKQWLLAAPDNQLDKCMFPLIEKWKHPIKAVQVLEVLDRCACFALASGWMMGVLHSLLRICIEDEGYENYNDLRAKADQPWLPLV